MKKFLVRFILLLLVPIPLLFALNHIVDEGLRRSRLPIYAEWNDIFSSRINADVLLCGSSRMAVHVSPKIVDSILGMNSYNIGMSGWPFNMQYARFKVYLQHNKKPAYIVQNIDYGLLAPRLDLFEYIQFLPYLKDTTLRRATDECEGYLTGREIYFPLFKYNNHLELVKEGLNCYFNTGHRAESGKYKGFANTQNTWNGTFEAFMKDNPNGTYATMQTKTINDFDEYLNYCKQNNIKVILEFSPIYYEGRLAEKNAGKVMDTVRKYAAKYDFPFLDYTTDTLCNYKKYFYDSKHLTAAGAQIFSTTLACDIKKLIDSGALHYKGTIHE